MRTVREMLREGVSVGSVLGTMDDRPRVEQREVWSIGLTKIAIDLARQTNRSANAIVERVTEGQVSGLFFDPLDVAEAYCRSELRNSRAREDGERKRQQWLMDVLVTIGSARQAGFGTLAEYPPATRLREAEDDEGQVG